MHTGTLSSASPLISQHRRGHDLTLAQALGALGTLLAHISRRANATRQNDAAIAKRRRLLFGRRGAGRVATRMKGTLR